MTTTIYRKTNIDPAVAKASNPLAHINKPGLLVKPEVGFEGLGLLPGILVHNDPAPVAEQLNTRYSHGGGYSPSSSNWQLDPESLDLIFPADADGPEERYEASAIFSMLSGEFAIFYRSGSWLAIIQPPATPPYDFTVCRVD
jgi:hypothetical protein